MKKGKAAKIKEKNGCKARKKRKAPAEAKELCANLLRFSVLIEIFGGFPVFNDFFGGFSVSRRLQCPTSILYPRQIGPYPWIQIKP